MGTMTSKAHPSDLYIGPSQESGFLKKKKKKPFTSLGKKKKKWPGNHHPGAGERAWLVKMFTAKLLVVL